MAEGQRSWEKRLAAKPDERTVDYVESLSYDRRLYKYDIVGSIAHAAMLAERKLITQAEFKAIKGGLVEISEEMEAVASCFCQPTTRAVPKIPEAT